MRAAVIPAQIITVEDRIAGNLTLTQISILIIPLIITLILYIAFPPLMRFSILKILIALGIAIISLFLAIRVKGKIIMQWLIILLRYQRRPGYYLYNKNDSYQRTIDPIIRKEAAVKHTIPKKVVGQKDNKSKIADLIKFDRLLTNPALSLRFKTNKKGALTVAVDQIT